MDGTTIGIIVTSILSVIFLITAGYLYLKGRKEKTKKSSGEEGVKIEEKSHTMEQPTTLPVKQEEKSADELEKTITEIEKNLLPSLYKQLEEAKSKDPKLLMRRIEHLEKSVEEIKKLLIEKKSEEKKLKK